MIDDESRRGAAVHVDRLHAASGGVGVQVRIDGGVSKRRSTVKTTVGEPPFVGRDTDLRAIEDGLHARRVVILHGTPGLGKSRLAREYAHAHATAYPGGMFLVPFDQTPPTELAKLLRGTGHTPYADEPIEDQCRRALEEIGSLGRALVIYDAVADEPILRDWLPYEGLDWHLIVTSTSASWARSWSVVDIAPLAPTAAQALVASILDDEAAAARLSAPIAAKAAGLTIELCASAAAARERLRRGRSVEGVSTELARQTMSSFESAWALLPEDARRALRLASAFEAPHVPWSLILGALQRLGWTMQAVEDAIDAARDRKLATGDSETIEIHRLVAQFVRAREALDVTTRRAMLSGLIECATHYGQRPNDPEQRARLLAHSLAAEDWADLIEDGRHWALIGNASAEAGRFRDALGWYRHAVAWAEGQGNASQLAATLHQNGLCHAGLGDYVAAGGCHQRAVELLEHGDANGRIDHAALSDALACVGLTLSREHKFQDALPWHLRALTSVERGDADGRVNGTTLGCCLFNIGQCHANLGAAADAMRWYERAIAPVKAGDPIGRVNGSLLAAILLALGAGCESRGEFDAALAWLERAVAAAELGDSHGRADFERVGQVLHRLASCHERVGKFEQALVWFQRAAVAKEKGDRFGRVNSHGIGMSLHRVGFCYASLGETERALGWFERALAAKEKGDPYGRVDPDLVGVSLYEIGACHRRLGRIDEARAYLERAVEAQTRGDVHGHVDPTTLGTSLHEIGCCHADLSQHDVALGWFTRAVSAKETGDHMGRVDSQSLGASLHEIGRCHQALGEHDVAPTWFERAIAAMDRGDTFGRVHRDRIGASCYQIGVCLERAGRHAEALTWFERAIAAHEHGSVLGQVDTHGLATSRDAALRCGVGAR